MTANGVVLVSLWTAVCLRQEYGDLMPGVFGFSTGDSRGQERKTAGGLSLWDVLKGKIKPLDCPLFASRCQPEDPVGPCMVSSEGACAAYFRFERGQGGRNG